MLALQIALGFGIAMLMPMLAYYATRCISPKHPMEPTKEKQDLRTRQQQNENYIKEQNQFQKKLFFVACSLGFCALAAGPFLSAKAVGTGLMFGGVLSIMEGVGCCWKELHPKAKFGFLLVTMIVLIVIGYHNLSS
ncbi:MAG TPA: hypothetical protein V6C81_16500 [Planktothrix sp.]|jgi:hypothetical protein